MKTEGIPEEIAELILSGRKIAAIDALRKELGCSLTKAKSIIDEFDDELGASVSETSIADTSIGAKSYRFSILERIFMMMRGSPVHQISRCLKAAKKYSLEVSAQDLELQHIAGGDLDQFIEGMIFAKSNGMKLDFSAAAARQLAGVEAGFSLLEQLESMFAKGITDANDEPIDF